MGKHILWAKKNIAIVVAVFVFILLTPLYAHAEVDIGSQYRIVMEHYGGIYDSNNGINDYIYDYFDGPVEPNFRVVRVDAPEHFRSYEDFDYYDYSELYILSNENYDFEFLNNDKPGTATLKVTGKGAYTGTLSKDFPIKEIVELDCTKNPDKSVTISNKDGSPITSSGLRVFADYEEELTKGSEYIFSDGKVIITKDFLEGKTGFKFTGVLLDVSIDILTDTSYGGIYVDAYDISNLPYTVESTFKDLYGNCLPKYLYNGKNRKIKVKIGYLEEGTDYKIVYGKKNRKDIGTYSFTIKGKGDYVGTIKGTFKIIPRKPAKMSVKRSGKTVRVQWKKVKNCSGYQVQLVDYDEDDDPEHEWQVYKKKTCKGKSSTKHVFKSASRKKYVCVRVRSYKTVKGKRYYSQWRYSKY